MTPSYKTLHKNFKLNGFSYSSDELRDLGHSFVKEGDDHERAIGSFLLDWSDENETIKVQTSGSTGEPRQILLKKEHMVNSALATGGLFELNPGNTALLCLSTDYIAGKMMLVRAMVLGLELDYVEPSSNPLNEVVKEYDFCAMVPLQLESSLKKMDQIKTLIVGGVRISNSLKEKTQNISCDVFETYGMTETITHIAIKRITNFAVGSQGHPELVEGPVENLFKALPEVVFSKDKRDCLIINAPKVSNEPVVTNDVVNLISDSAFEWLGRYDNVINSGGVKLFPEQIEAKLSKIIPQRFFVAGLPDEKLGQKLVLILEGEADTIILSQKMANLESLEKYGVPNEILVLPRFLETETGKIRRKENINLILA